MKGPNPLLIVCILLILAGLALWLTTTAHAAPVDICRRVTIVGYPRHITCGATGCIGELRTGSGSNATTVFVRGWRLYPWRQVRKTILVCS